MKHPLSAKDRYTPITPQLLTLMVRMRDELGGWAEVAAISGTRKRVLRRIYRLETKAVAMELMDRLTSTTEIGHVSEFLWFTAEDLVALGIWDACDFDLATVKVLNRQERKRRRQDKYNARMRLKRRMRTVRRVERVRQEKIRRVLYEGWTPPWEIKRRR